MFHWRIIIILIIIQIIFFIYNYKQIPQNKTCINSFIIDFALLWIEFNITLIDYSKSIIKKNTNIVLLHNKTLEIKNKLLNIFNKMYPNIDNFENLINNEIIIKTNLCISINIDDQDAIKEYSKQLAENNKKIINIFIKIKNNKTNDKEFKKLMNNHEQLYIKTMSNIKKINNDELQRELVLGSIDTVKLLFI
jgi:hypothetical protein